jgi:hypothetical protein
VSLRFQSLGKASPLKRPLAGISRKRYCQKFYENQGITHENDKREQSRGEEEVG